MAQKTTQAVMQVQAEVIAGSHVEESIVRDISDQLNHSASNDPFLQFGEYVLTVPDGASMIATSQSNIRMVNGGDEFIIETSVEKRVAAEGKIIYNLSGSTNKDNIQPGSYEGEQWITIEYL